MYRNQPDGGGGGLGGGDGGGLGGGDGGGLGGGGDGGGGDGKAADGPPINKSKAIVDTSPIRARIWIPGAWTSYMFQPVGRPSKFTRQ